MIFLGIYLAFQNICIRQPTSAYITKRLIWKPSFGDVGKMFMYCKYFYMIRDSGHVIFYTVFIFGGTETIVRHNLQTNLQKKL